MWIYYRDVHVHRIKGKAFLRTVASCNYQQLMLTTWSRAVTKKLRGSQLVRSYVGPEYLLLSSQYRTTMPCPKPDESGLYSHAPFLYNQINIIPHTSLHLSSNLLPSGFWRKMRTSLPSPLFLLHVLPIWSSLIWSQLLYCGIFAQGKNCEASSDSRCLGTALETRPLLGNKFVKLKKKLNSVACSPQANYTDRAAAAC
jgi:hypothetical protein